MKKITGKRKLSLADNVDLLYRMSQERKSVEQKLKHEEKVQSERVIGMLNTENAQRVTGQLANAALTELIVPTVSDWKKAWAFIKQPKNVDLVKQAINSKAWRDRYKEGKLVPGTTAFKKIGLSLTKRKK